MHDEQLVVAQQQHVSERRDGNATVVLEQADAARGGRGDAVLDVSQVAEVELDGS